MRKLLNTLLFIILLLSLGAGVSHAYFVGQHWVVGTMAAESAELLDAVQDREIRVYLRSDPNNYITDSIGVNGNSGTANQFQVNIFENPN